ncbi:MAG: hypothetical protein GC192_16535 [Bacteroidetes bacterium]|nr:hypothetical protein [Bacteroidota bacterium]
MESNINLEEKQENKKRGFAWWWLLIPVLAIGMRWFLSQTKKTAPPIETAAAEIKLCSMAQMSVTGHCCLQELQQLSMFNDGAALNVTVKLAGQNSTGADLSAVVLWPSGEVFPTNTLHLALDTAVENDCYWSAITPLHGIKWTVGKYRVQVKMGDKVIGEKSFEIVQ